MTVTVTLLPFAIVSGHCRHNHAAAAAAARTVIAAVRPSHGVQERRLAAAMKINFKQQFIAAHGI